MIQDIFPHRFRLDYQCSLPGEGDPVFVFRGANKREDRALASEAGEGVLPTYGGLLAAGAITDIGQLQFLFSIDETAYYLLNNGGTADIELPGFAYVAIRSFSSGGMAAALAFAGMTAYHLFSWYRDTIHCGRCGHKMVPFAAERAMECPACRNLVYPKLMPAVIIAVKDGERLLVSRYAGREYSGLALLAGFCEVGETLEQTVAREVQEEVGLRVKNITYFGSQPWGVDSNLLVGFTADVDGSTEIHMDKQELAAAGWVERSEIEPPQNLASLTATMMEAFRTGQIR